MTFQELIQDIPAAEITWQQGDLNVEVRSIAYDSRRATVQSLFAALPGEAVDGHRFIPQALAQGAVAVIAEQKNDIPRQLPAVGFKRARYGLACMAARFWGEPSMRVKMVGITGTNGKTTVSYLVEALLKDAGLAPGVTGTVNYRYGTVVKPSLMTTPESLDFQTLLAEMDAHGVKAVVSEISSHALVMSRCEGVDFDVAVFTNLSRDHLDFHGDMETYFAAKCGLFTDLLTRSRKKNPAAVINIDDEYGKKLAAEVTVPVVTYSCRDAEARVSGSKVQFSQQGITAQVRCGDRTLTLQSPLLGEHNFSNLLCAIAVAEALGLDIAKAVQALAHFDGVPGRLQRVINTQNRTVVVDYAHTPDALEKVLGTLRPLVERGRRLFCVFGCGGDRDAGKRPLMGEVATRLADWTFITSDNPRTESPQAIIDAIQLGVTRNGGRVEQEVDRERAICRALSVLSPGDILLIAGKGHENYQIIGEQKFPFDDVEVARRALEQDRCA